MKNGDLQPWEIPPDEGYWRALLADVDRLSAYELSPYDPCAIPEEALRPPPSIPSVAEGVEEPKRSGQRPAAAVSPHTPPAEAFAAEWERAEHLLQSKERVDLRVTGYNRGGLLVRFGSLQGFVPTSQLIDLPDESDDDIRQAQLARRVGEVLCLRVIEIDRGRNRLIFSERAAVNEHEGLALLGSLAPGQVRTGRVNALCGFGAFVDLGGVEGFIHISEFSWSRVNHPADMLRVGDEIQVYVIDVQPAHQRVALSLKRLKPDPWSLVDQRYHVGDIVEGEVTNVVSFGAFVRLEEGVEGLIHVSELADGNFLHPRNVVKEGDRVRARVIRVDGAQHRLGLSLRQVGE
ncbi:MAG: 30S ribosomal protein S1 [Anaerolineae bacterium]